MSSRVSVILTDDPTPEVATQIRRYLAEHRCPACHRCSTLAKNPRDGYVLVYCCPVGGTQHVTYAERWRTLGPLAQVERDLLSGAPIPGTREP